jgi:Ala-tRNA(Pro) deacylase
VGRGALGTGPVKPSRPLPAIRLPDEQALRPVRKTAAVIDLSAMPVSPDDLFAFLDRLGIHYSTVSHQPLFTVEESRASRGTIPGGHTKNLFLKDKSGGHYLVVACEDAMIDLKGLHRRLGAKGRFSFGSADAMWELLGVRPGSVTPFAAINDVSGKVVVILDSAMLTHELLNYHPLVNTMTTSIPRDGLVTFLNACGHEPRIESASDTRPAGVEGQGGSGGPA